MWKEWERVAKHNAPMIFFGTQPFVSELIESNRKLFRYDLIWYKISGTGHLNAKDMPLRNHEHILVFYKKLPTYNPQKTTGHQRKVSTAKHKRNSKASSNYGSFGLTTYDSTERYPESVLFFAKEPNPTHPTQKPLDLIRYLIKTYSNEGDMVFDGYAGSGTTPEACIIEKRLFKGSEMEAEFFQPSITRLEERLQKPELL